MTSTVRVTFTYGTNRYTYNGSDVDLTVGSLTYESQPISDDDYEVTQEGIQNNYKLTVPITLEILELYRTTSPAGTVDVLIEECLIEDPSTSEVIFIGRISDVLWRIHDVDIICESTAEYSSRVGLRLTYEYGCQNMLFDERCKVDRSNFETVGTANTVGPNSVVVVAAIGKASNWYPGGFIEYTHSRLGVVVRNFISSYDSGTGTLVLLNYPDGLEQGQSLSAFSGCDHTFQMCIERYDNHEEFSGDPFMPQKDTYGGDPIF